jgi:AraC family transcriptional regulator, chemosensory pili system protein ChpD
MMQQRSVLCENFEAGVLWGSNMRFEPHGHDEFVVSTNICGNESFRLDRKSLQAQTGATTYYNPAQIQSGEGTNKLASLYLQPDIFLKDFHLMGDIHFESPVQHCENTLSSMQQLMTHILTDSDAGIIEELGLKVLHMGLQGNSSCRIENIPNRKDWRIERIKQRLMDDLATAPDLKVLANEVRLAKATMIRMFSSSTGFPPLTWQRAKRLQQARSLLRTGRPIAYVALDLGFSDQAHLCRKFKSAFGLTPGKIQLSH